MCLAIPSKVTHIENQTATIDVDGVRRSASLLMLEDVAVGDWVIVHAGFAIHKIDEQIASLRKIFTSFENGHESRATIAVKATKDR